MEDSLTFARMFEESEEATRNARQYAERDRDYYDGKQWTAEEEQALKKRNQPVVTFNRIQRKIDFLSGLEKQQRKDPKAFPRNPKDQGAADAATDAIRYVCDDTDWDAKRSSAWDDLLIEGVCAILVGHKERRDGVDPELIHIPWDRYYYDPHSSRADFSDKTYDGIVTWYDLDEAKRKWPDREDILVATWKQDLGSETYDDKPKVKLWSDYKRQRIRVCEQYHKKAGAWHRVVFTQGGVLEDEQPSPYLDEDGQPENPIKSTALYVDRDNNRYGSVRVMISAQDEINKRRSKALWRASARQIRIAPGAAMDRETARSEAQRPDGILEGDKDEVEVLNNGDLLMAEINMLQEAKAEIDLQGANAALSGKNENDMSGRAIMAQQQGGMVEVARMFDRLRMLSIEVYRSVWNRVRQFWQAERWVRVTDSENNLRFVGLNQQVTVAQLAQEVAEGDQEAIAKAAEIVSPQLMQAYMQQDNPQLQQQAQTALGLFVQQNGSQVVEVRNAVNELDVDIVIDEGMDTPTVQAEQFDTLVKMLPGLGEFAQSPQVMQMLIEASSLRNKDRLVELLEQAQQAPAPDPMAEQMQQLQMAGAVKQIEKTESETIRNLAQAETAAMGTNDPAEQALRAAEIENDRFGLETDRYEAMKPEPRAA